MKNKHVIISLAKQHGPTFGSVEQLYIHGIKGSEMDLIEARLSESAVVYILFPKKKFKICYLFLFLCNAIKTYTKTQCLNYVKTEYSMYTFLNMVEKFGFSVNVFIAIHINTHKTNFNPFCF